MLAVLKKHLLDNSYFFEKELGVIPHSSCPTSIIRVLDFDAVKDRFSVELRMSSLKSVDAIYFSNTRDEIYLIEMKRYVAGGLHSCVDYVKSHLGPNGLPNKIIDSIFILLGIMGYYQIDKSFYSFFLDPSKLKIKCLLLVDFSSSDLLALTLASQHKHNISLTKKVESEIGVINCSAFQRHFATL
jgi:hypothetical protein